MHRPFRHRIGRFFMPTPPALKNKTLKINMLDEDLSYCA